MPTSTFPQSVWNNVLAAANAARRRGLFRSSILAVAVFACAIVAIIGLFRDLWFFLGGIVAFWILQVWYFLSIDKTHRLVRQTLLPFVAQDVSAGIPGTTLDYETDPGQLIDRVRMCVSGNRTVKTSNGDSIGGRANGLPILFGYVDVCEEKTEQRSANSSDETQTTRTTQRTLFCGVAISLGFTEYLAALAEAGRPSGGWPASVMTDADVRSRIGKYLRKAIAGSKKPKFAVRNDTLVIMLPTKTNPFDCGLWRSISSNAVSRMGAAVESIAKLVDVLSLDGQAVERLVGLQRAAPERAPPPSGDAVPAPRIGQPAESKTGDPAAPVPLFEETATICDRCDRKVTFRAYLASASGETKDFSSASPPLGWPDIHTLYPVEYSDGTAEQICDGVRALRGHRIMVIKESADRGALVWLRLGENRRYRIRKGVGTAGTLNFDTGEFRVHDVEVPWAHSWTHRWKPFALLAVLVFFASLFWTGFNGALAAALFVAWPAYLVHYFVVDHHSRKKGTECLHTRVMQYTASNCPGLKLRETLR